MKNDRIPLSEQVWSPEFPPLATVRTMAYMQEAFIRDTIEGVLMQKTNFRVQYVIHDDASKDGTAGIIREYEAKYPDLIKGFYQSVNTHTHPNKSEMRQPVRDACVGKYIAICEGDDYWTDPDKLQKQIDFMEANPDVSLSYHRVDRVNENGEIIKPGKCGEVTIHAGKSTLSLQIPTLSIVYRRDAVDHSKFPKAPHGDAVLFAYAATQGFFVDMGFVGAAYRVHSGGIFMGISPAKRFINTIITRRRILEAGFLNEDMAAEMRILIAKKRKEFTKILLKKGRFIDVFRLWRV